MRCKRHQLQVWERDSPGRTELERFIRTAFAHRHGASVSAFMPTLLGVRGDGGQLCGVVGLRAAVQQPLFLENYFAEPIERVLSRVTGQQIERGQIVEAGNLAGTSCRAASRLVFQLPQILLDRGHDWLVFTATAGLRKLLAAYAAPVIELAQAQGACVANMGDDWGSYYATDPRVMAAYLPAALRLRRAHPRAV
jgi:hypothetical protein